MNRALFVGRSIPTGKDGAQALQDTQANRLVYIIYIIGTNVMRCFLFESLLRKGSRRLSRQDLLWTWRR